MAKLFIAVDIGASSGRLMAGEYTAEQLTLTEVHRFNNTLVERDQQVCWNLDELLGQIQYGVDQLVAGGQVPDSLAIDTWGVDYVLLDNQGERIGEAVSYRDPRTSDAMNDFFAHTLTKEQLYAETGIQFLSFNTLFQLSVDKRLQGPERDTIASLLMIPDYLNYRLTGKMHFEYSNASTTQLLNAAQQQWSPLLLECCNIDRNWIRPTEQPFQVIGEYTVRDHAIPVVSVASHDTASAVIGAPLLDSHSAYLCSGTWSLMGFEHHSPVINTFTREANITNEGGAEGRYRILKNIMGLWLVQNVQRQNPSYSFAELATLAAASTPFAYLINPDDARFLNPEDMQAEIIAFCQQTGQGTPPDLAAIVRCIYDSLALQYLNVFQELNRVAPHPLTHIQVVGGGSNNTFLNQLTADVCQTPVSAGPAEASAIGNLIGQLIAHGDLAHVEEGRALVRRSFTCHEYQPKPIKGMAQIYARFQQLTY
ncbi:rhamnulokinase [Vibrio furnissii]|uniref:Rhamnulokinase n=2 Tax=Vibrio TaxID=662 RepID=A0A0Q2SJY5_VIBFU|nr:rhamnulokinase [Vibrio furnissii]KQH87907.1 rhamnulokinase [Vibrio furnissii]MCG6266912.1 rhamnulokinase [Vibrio furnissii]WJG24365.1 rhamnulokinase [Vibrio furnissii]